MTFQMLHKKHHPPALAALLLCFVLVSIFPTRLSAQGPMRVYVLRTGDNQSDLAVVQALTERGHIVDLGVRAAQLDTASVELSEYHVVVALGAPGQGIPATAVTKLAKYLNGSGGLLVDGEMLYQMPGDAVTTLQLPVRLCGELLHPIASTTLDRTDPADPVVHNGVPASFSISLTTLRVPGFGVARVENCLTTLPLSKQFFSSRAASETRVRPAVAGIEPTSRSRVISFSVAIRTREMQSLEFSNAFVNSVEWAGARSVPNLRIPADVPSATLRLYVLRTEDDASDRAVVEALTERGHIVDLGVRAGQLESASVRLSDYHGVVALGVPGEGINAGVIRILNAYLRESGGLIADGEFMYQLPRDAVADLQLPATHCGELLHAIPTASFERIEPLEPTIHAGLPRFFDVPLTTLRVPGFGVARVENCLAPAGGAKLFLYSRRSEEALSLPAAVANEPGPKRRAISFSTAIRRLELQSPNFRRLFVNAMEWASANSSPSAPSRPQLTSKALRVYVLRTGEAATDAAVTEALTERGHSVILGVRASQLPTAPVLSGFDAVVALGTPGEGVGSAGIAVLSRYLQSSGRLIVDGEMMYNLDRGEVVNLRLPAVHCGELLGAESSTLFERVDPADPFLHKNIPPSFPLSLSILQVPGFGVRRTEHCLTPAGNAKIRFYSRQRDERIPRPGLLTNEPELKSRAAVFSVAVRSRELLNPNFRNAFVNAVEWAAEQIADPLTFDASPSQLSYIFRSSADSPRPQILEVTPTTLNPVALSVTASTASGGDWLTVTPDRGTTPTKFTVRVAPVFLPPGIYLGEVTITGAGSVVRVPVRVVVNATAPCTFSLSPSSASFSAAGGLGTLGVIAPPGCAWAVTSNSSWIAISAGAAGSGSGTVSYSVATSNTLAARSGSLTAAGATFSVNQSGTGLSFRLEPSTLDFRATESAAAPDGRVVSIFSTAANTNFSVSVSGGTWLSATPSTGTAPGSILVSAASTGLLPGVYRGSAAIRIAGATVPEQTLPVTLTVAAAETSQLHVEPATLTLPAVQGGEAKSDRFFIVNQGRGTLAFRASVEDAPWLTVQPDSGNVLPGATQPLTISGDPRDLQPGSYTARITISSASGEKAIVSAVLTVGTGKQSILLSQTGLSYTAVAQGGRVLPQSFGVLNAGSGILDWTATATTLSGGSWLSVSQLRGSADAAALDIPLINVGVEAGALRPGEYHGRIAISSPTAANSPQIASVILQVLPPGSDPGPVVRPTGLIFVVPPGGPAAAPQEVSVSNPTADPRSFNSNRLTTDNANLFTHTPVQSAVSPNQPTRISVQSSAAGLTPGVRRGVLTLLFGDGAVQNVNILSIVPPQAAPNSKGNREAASCPSDKLVLVHRTLRQDFVAVLGQGVTIDVKAADSCGNLLIPSKSAPAQVVATFSNDDPRVNLVHIGGGVWTGTWRPVRKADRVAVSVTAISIEGIPPRAQAEQVTLSGSVRESGQTPVITAGGLVNGASFAAGVPIAPGSLVTLFGANLADDSASPDRLPLPRELNGLEVLLGDRSLPLFYVSKGQVNVQVPFGLPLNTQHQISVRRGQELSVPETVTVAEAVPGIFTANSSGTGQGLIFKAEGNRLADSANPAKAGDVIVVYCTGLGVVIPTVEPGDPSPSQILARVPAPVELSIGGKKAQTLFVGLTSNNVGLYQINAVVPEGVAPGNAVNVVIAAGGQTSPTVTMAVR